MEDAAGRRRPRPQVLLPTGRTTHSIKVRTDSGHTLSGRLAPEQDSFFAELPGSHRCDSIPSAEMDAAFSHVTNAQVYFCAYLLSLPTRGAWIEITFAKGPSGCMGSLPHRGRGGSRLRRPEQKKKDTTEGLSPIGTQCGPMGLNAVYGERAILWSICRKIALNLLGCLFEGTHNYFRATGVDEHSTP